MKTSLHRPLSARDVAVFDIETDIAIIGFGAAGSCAALEARAAGKRVTIFEAASGGGGTSAMSGGEFYIGGSGGTDAQRAAGFADSTKDFSTYLKMVGGPDADIEKCDLYAEHSVAHYEWLKSMGVPFKGSFRPGKIIEPETDDTLVYSGSEEAWPFSESAKPAPRGHVIQWEGWGGGKLLMQILESKVRESGADVRTDSKVVSLIQDDDRIVGLIAQIDGRPVYVRAAAVIICTGGFCLNSEMVRRYAPEALRLSDPIGAKDDGSGIQMGIGAGGDAIHMDEFFTTCPWIMPESLVKGIFVNSRGQRFINEDCYHGRVSRHMIDQPGDRVWLLVDNAIFGRPIDLARIEIAAVGESWEAIESELGLPADTLSATVRTFNRYAAGGEDPICHKAAKWLKVLDEPPFAALELNFSRSFFSFFTLGGLATSPRGEVLDRTGAPIAGLFAAGRVTSGLPRSGHGYSSGMSLADATFFGRQAGSRAAAER